MRWGAVLGGALLLVGTATAAWGRPGGQPPPNDNFAAAETISTAFSSNYIADTTAATTESGEPVQYGCQPTDLQPGAVINTGKTVWYRLLLPASAVVSLNTGNSDYDTTLGVLTGGTVDALTPLTCDDDRADGYRAALLTFRALAGTEYRVQAGGYALTPGVPESAAGGHFEMGVFIQTVTPIPSPTLTPTATRTATPSVTPTATPPRARTPAPSATSTAGTGGCTPRPPVQMVTQAGGGQLQATITAPAGLRSLQLTRLANATALVNGQAVGLGSTVVSGTTATLTVRHAQPGASTVELVVQDGCGAWPTFVGGGASAF